jgi:tRNA pseudouridine38-40 synthase
MAAINSRLPEDIVVTHCELAPEDFHATHSVRSKVYRYTLVVGGPRPVIDRNFVYHIHHELDVELMRRAAECLVGEHDFASFVSEHSPEKNTVRTVHRLEIERRGRYVTVTVEGNGFLYNMVRTMVGCLVAVGRGLRPVAWMKEMLESHDRSKALATAKAQGLTMVKTNY